MREREASTSAGLVPPFLMRQISVNKYVEVESDMGMEGRRRKGLNMMNSYNLLFNWVLFGTTFSKTNSSFFLVTFIHYSF